tara:strand:+ start:779 stop:1099 length:321 start_codon:yes stop_codon:yes gene_type:complete
MSTLYIGATLQAIGAAFLVANDFGIISPNIRSKNVTTHVDTQIAKLCSTHMPCARFIAIVVAKAAVYVFTKLFQIRIVIRSLSLFSLIFLRDFDHIFPSFTRASIL